MRIATWNVNSIRARVDRTIRYLQDREIDVLAMQETKCRTDAFPYQAFDQAGYQVACWGTNQWNGVAVASRVGLENVREGFAGQPRWGDPDVLEPRALGAQCGGVDVWSLYIPHGRGLADPHMAYKLTFLSKLRDQAAEWLKEDPDSQVALVGDWNVAPLDTDVWDIAAFEGATHVSSKERAAFAAFADAGYREVTREHLPEPEKYTYWDYQKLRFPRNEGMRIDFAYCTPALADRVESVTVVRDERKGKGASDHVPVELEIG